MPPPPGSPADDQDRTVLSDGLSPDVGELRRALERLSRREQELEAAHHRLERALAAAQVGTWHTDLATGADHWDDNLARLFGHPDGAHVHYLRDFLAAVHPADRERVARAVDDAVRGGTGFDLEYRVVWPDGSVHWLKDRGHAFTGADGRPSHMTGVCVDVTDRRRAEEQSRELAEERRLALEVARLGTWRLDVAAGVMRWDARGRAINGILPDAHPLYPEVTAIVHPDDVARVEAAFERVLDPARREPYWVEHRVLWPDGSVHWVAANGVAVFDGDGPTARALHVVGTVMDITGRKQAEEALRDREERFRAIFDQTSVGIAQADLEGRFVLANARFCEIVGRTREALFPLRMQDITHPDHLAQNVAAFERLVATGEPFVIEKRYVRPDGSTIWVSNSVSLVRSPEGAPQYVVAVVRDLTGEKQAEELRRSNRDLEQFASVASHDLKEPLRKIQSFSQLLGEGFADALGEEGRLYVTRMQQAAGRMEGLIHDLLTYSRVAARPEPPRPVDLGAIARDVVGDLELRLEETHGRVEVGPLPILPADPLQMRQLFQNLIGNALKFHREGVPPVVRIEAEEARDGQGRRVVRVTVADNGIGFDERHAEQVFDPFFRVYGRSRFDGTGMGLAICRRIVEGHGGTIRARSTPGQGSTFTVSLPA